MKIILGIIVYIVGLMLFFGAIYLLGYSGLMLRGGIETRKALGDIREDARKKGLSINEKWFKLNRKSLAKIVFPIFGWIGVYVIAFEILPPKLFFVSLLALIVPVLGYFGIFFTPSDDPGDYY